MRQPSLIYFAGLSLIAPLTAASVIAGANTLRSLKSNFAFAKRDKPPWPYGVIGDSWGSGVAYNDDVLYDDNRDKCLRTKESHG